MNSIQKILAAASLALLAACNLTKDVNIDLPGYEAQPVVECYLEDGQPLTLLLTKSAPYFDTLGTPQNWLSNIFLDSATVVVIGPAGRDTLDNSLTFNPFTGKFFNYWSPTIAKLTTGETWKLEITLKNGKRIEGQTVVVSPIKIDSVSVEWQTNDTLARILTYSTDDPATQDFYRRQYHKTTLDTIPQIDFVTDDGFFDTKLIAFGTLYELKKGDTVFNTVFHLEKPYYEFLNTLSFAVQSNGNPFAQPARIKSNVIGSANPIGIFTALRYDRVRTIISK